MITDNIAQIVALIKIEFNLYTISQTEGMSGFNMCSRTDTAETPM